MLNKIKAIHTIEYLRYETKNLEKYSTDIKEDSLLQAFKTVLQFVEDCNEDYLDEIKETPENKKTIEVPTVTLKLHLYTTDEDDNYIPMSNEDAEEAVEYITSADDVAGYSITDYEVTTEELEIPNC